MWICDQCGRAFKNTNQDHFCGEPAKLIDDYIAQQSESVQPQLRQVYAALKGALPDAEERISWHMPTFWRGHNLVHFAAFKNHIGLYPGAEAVEHFADELKGYKASKGAIRLPLSQPMPQNLIVRIAAWCGDRV